MSNAIMKTPASKARSKNTGELRPEYRFDYTKSKPNRFAAAAPSGSVAVLLDPDVARIFKSSESVNAVLRAVITAMPARRTHASRDR